MRMPRNLQCSLPIEKGRENAGVCCLQHPSSSSQAGILPVARVSYGRRERQSQAAVQPTIRLFPTPG